MFELKNKVAIVTGSARGIGKAIALSLAKQGCNIVVSDIIDGNETVKKIVKLKRKVMYIKTDVSDKSSINSLVNETIKKFKKIDILVNNAGIFRTAPSETLSEQDWDKVININLKGYFLCAQAVSKYMIKRKKGNIVNISSVAGLFGFQSATAYCSSKGGIMLLTKTLAAEWAKYNIRVNAVCPGIIVTAMTKDLLKNKEFKKTTLQKVPLQRVGYPKDISGAVAFLVSDEASYITGSSLVIDGGWTCTL